MMLEDDSGPLSLTDLYTRLAQTEDELRTEKHECQKLKILINRIHRDVAAKTPIFHQKQLELESALEKLDRCCFAHTLPPQTKQLNTIINH